MKYRIVAKGRQVNPNGTVFEEDNAAATYTKYLATKSLFGDALVYDETGAVDEAELRQRALASGWSG